MLVEKEVLHQLARRLRPNGTTPEEMGTAMRQKVQDLAEKISALTAEKTDQMVLLELK